MRYISTRGNAPVLSFEEAMLTGLARDGGLYVPETIPQMRAEDIRALRGLSYEEVAFSVMRPPAKLLGSSRPRTKSASVTAGRVPPRP